MSASQLWEFLEHGLQSHGSMGLLIVIDSQGSSPGRLGFKMALAPNGAMRGSIGGGIMEHKLVEWMRHRLANQLHTWETRQQIHSKSAPQHQSGMICSGQQTIALLRLGPQHQSIIAAIHKKVADGQQIYLRINQDGMLIKDSLDFGTHVVSYPKGADQSVIAPSMQSKPSPLADTFESEQASAWSYAETIGIKDIAYVIGAGHVGFAMCQVLTALDFHVINIDDRPGLNTMQDNIFAQQKLVCPYTELASHVQPGPQSYVIVMTFGYRGDDAAIRALLGKSYRYLGMMGSQTKVAQLIQGLKNDGYIDDEIASIHTPAGLVHHCKTPMEIAISIAAEIIQVRNLST